MNRELSIEDRGVVALEEGGVPWLRALSLQDRRVASVGTFIALANFVTLVHDRVFWQITTNTVVYTIVALITVDLIFTATFYFLGF